MIRNGEPIAFAEWRMALITHEFLRQERDRIMSEWERSIREAPHPISLEDSALRNDLPEFIDALASWVKSEEEPAGGILRDVPARHAKQRLKNAYELAQVISEFRVLRVTILRLLLQAEAVERARPDLHDDTETRVVELARLHAGLDQAISDSVESFVKEREAIRERFIGVLGHDLRTPLSSILMTADHMLRSGRLQPGLDKAAGRIARSAARMSRMVRDLLDLARGRLADGIPITASHMDMGEICRAAADDASITHPGREIAIEAGFELWGEWDRDRAFQAVGNLVGNALQYGQGPVTISVSSDADNVVVSVTNRGEPIPQDHLSKLFDPFQRGEAGGERTEGLGLGLYIVSEIMRAHGGNVTVASSRERGTTFTLTWPRTRAHHLHGRSSAGDLTGGST
jgi:signal transduction histidine kinase